ncbi:HNH endonuclease [Pseudomonas sp. S75]|uniref:HNH endonuclease n=1 Tax=unclassified Pseudomonas TaxID=196821 RepID=UPI001908B70A|nr:MULTISPECIES: HNH endonuclease [unclassified Pseudomonas]MBJ9976790.1 HNH endonuclease [Pseudomonas sp. S30]MBK0153792.1 HNH endonuclease [Pseudomonas sp. S75]
MPVVIVENDTSQWEDETGAVYHFPKRYQNFLKQGAEVIYYKGRIKDKSFASERLSSDPHYFGTARIGKVYKDSQSSKGDLYALIEGYTRFEKAVPAKIDGRYLEEIPENRTSNYWRDGVRPISKNNYDLILGHAVLIIKNLETHHSVSNIDPLDFESKNEGSKTTYFGTRYERQKDLRLKAIAIHGLSCTACGFDFERVYGEYAKGFIHVHHIVPISSYGEDKAVDPETDLVTLCANCHAVVHRKREETLSIDQLKAMLKRQLASDYTPDEHL